MCGIAGVLSSGVEPASLIQRIIGEIQHRGPDDVGNWSVDFDSGRGLSLGHRRLSIIDLSELIYHNAASGSWLPRTRKLTVEMFSG
jgi:asparagine synthetase B (glutamine-hydrolysing)